MQSRLVALLPQQAGSSITRTPSQKFKGGILSFEKWANIWTYCPLVRLIKRSTLRHYASRFPKANRALSDWAQMVLSGKWQNLVKTRRMFPNADQVKVKSGKVVTIFNVYGNDFRLITAIHYDRQKVFVLNFLTHAEYSRDQWKNRL